MSGTGEEIRIRPATAADEGAIAAIWVPGWREAHEGRVPDELLEHRSADDLRGRVASMIETATVAEIDGSVAGFVVVRDDCVDQMYVGESHRGTGAAGALLTHAEGEIAERHERAWLAVVAGNDRARRFYDRHGWTDEGLFDHLTWRTDDREIPVPCRRYEKDLGASS